MDQTCPTVPTRRIRAYSECIGNLRFSCLSRFILCTLKMETACYSETSVAICPSTHCHTPENRNLCRQNFFPPLYMAFISVRINRQMQRKQSPKHIFGPVSRAYLGKNPAGGQRSGNDVTNARYR
jgi:hypothetical protein